MMKSVQTQFRRLAISLFLVMIIVIISLILAESIKIRKSASNEIAVADAQNMVNQFELILDHEIDLSRQLAKNKEIIAWFQDESNQRLKYQAFESISEYNALFEYENTFVTVGDSGHFYLNAKGEPLEIFKPLGAVSPNIADDLWYYILKDSDEDYMLNVDVDRYKNTMRVWVNTKVMNQGQMIGAIGTGIYIDQLVQNVYSQDHFDDLHALIINEYGAIQLDKDIDNIKQNAFTFSEETDNTIFEIDGMQYYQRDIMAFLQGDEKELVLEIEGNLNDIMVMHKIADTGWSVVSYYSSDSLFNLAQFLPIFIILILVWASFSIMITSSANKLFTHPMRMMIESIEESTEGIIVGTDRQDEWGTLARTIAHMRNKLDSYNHDLQEEVTLRTADLELAYEKISINEERLQRMVDNIPVGIFMLNRERRLKYANPYLIQQFGFEDYKTFERFVQTQLEAIFKTNEDYNSYMTYIEGNPKQKSIELTLQKQNGESFWAEMTLCSISEIDEDWAFEGILINTQAQKDYELQLLDLATRDQLTHLYNRRYFDQVLKEEIKRNNRYNEELSLIVFDLDFFKTINDTYGHNIGDEVLVSVSQAVQKAIRASDILARWGGEEFIILLPKTSQNEAKIVAEKLRQMIDEMRFNSDLHVTSSFGVAQRLTNEDYIDWFRRVDKALYTAKNNGRNQVAICDWVEEVTTELYQLKWGSQFEFGIPEMDEEHQLLFELSNQLMEKMVNQIDVSNTFQSFISHVLQHFEEEENFMHSVNYNNVASHEKAHHEITNKMHRIYNDYLNKHVAIKDFYQFLANDVIMEHILKEDLAFANFMNTGENKTET